MNISVKEGNISIDVYELLDYLKDDEKLKLVEALSCHDAIIKHVADQIIYGFTENGWHGSRGSSETPFTEIDKARRFVAEKSGDVAKKEIKRLEGMVKTKEEFLQKSRDKIYELEAQARLSL